MVFKKDEIIKQYLKNVKLITKYNKLYHLDDAPQVSDSDYDNLKKKQLS